MMVWHCFTYQVSKYEKHKLNEQLKNYFYTDNRTKTLGFYLKNNDLKFSINLDLWYVCVLYY